MDKSIITRFDKTPPPIKTTDVVCPHFMELKWAYGCPFDCAWCYLKGTFRFQPTKTNPVIKNSQKVYDHTKKFIDSTNTPEILNSGELADSLMSEKTAHPFSKLIIPMFEAQTKHKILFVTKSNAIDNLLDMPTHNRVIISFSLNSTEVAQKWEHKAPTPKARIKAAKHLFDNGYEVRLRIDPIVPVDDWRKSYKQLIDEIFDNLAPERITLGSLRGLPSTINNCSDKTWTTYLAEKSNWGKKIAFEIRLQMYSNIIDSINKHRRTTLSLCKETIQMWESLGLDLNQVKCNCVW